MNRRELREQLFMLLFRKEFHTEAEMNEQLAIYSREGEDPADDEQHPIDGEDLDFITDKCRRILELLPEIDAALSDNTENWSLSRIGKTELTILRLAVYEMRYDDTIPVGVAINEAVELCKRFCQDGAASFVNGILAKFTRGSDGDGTDPTDPVDDLQDGKDSAPIMREDKPSESDVSSDKKAARGAGGAKVIVLDKEKKRHLEKSQKSTDK